MRQKLSVISALAMFLLFSECNEEGNFVEHDGLTGEYLGQTPPGEYPRIFAPGIVSVPENFEHSASVFSPGLDAVYWSARPDGEQYFRIFFMELEEGGWTAPKPVPFTQRGNLNRPALSPDGNTLFYDDNEDIYSVIKAGDTWMEPILLPEIINRGTETMQCIIQDGSIYFSRANFEDGLTPASEEIHVSRMIGGSFSEPEKLDEKINSEYARELACYVPPDENYIIIEALDESQRNGNLYISYKLEDESWSERVLIENVGNARFPSVSPDGKYLFFIRIDSGIYWVSTSFIEDLKPD